MRVLNTDAETVIPEVVHKRNVLEKFMGLRFKREGRALFSFRWPTRAALDMAFVLGPLDMAFLDEDLRILEIHGAFPLTPNPLTWRTYRPEQPYKYALEVERGLLQDKGFAEGHELKIIDDGGGQR